MEPVGSLPTLQVPAIFSYPELLYINTKFICVAGKMLNLF